VSLPVVIRPATRQDIQDAHDWYEERRRGLGREFVIQVLALLDRLGDMPELYGVVWRNVRAVGVKRFGYVVYYRVARNLVEVLAVMRGGREPSDWQSRA
jgi:plasmid stabilization system protein ParE